MSIPFPSIRRPSQAAWALRAQTQTHRSPLDGTTQTLRQPAERWVASVSWPTLVDPDRRVLEAFLAGLGGQAGRFFFGPVHAPRRALGSGPLRTNFLPNGEWVGAGVGVYPTGWVMTNLNAGCTASVTATGADSNGNWIDITFAGTPTGTADVGFLRTDAAGTAPTGAGATVTAAVTFQTQGTVTNIAVARVGAQEVNVSGAYVGGITWSVNGLSASVVRRTATRTVTNVRSGWVNQVAATTIGSPIALTLRLWQPQLEAGATATAYIPTTTGPVTVSDPPQINGAGQSGSTLSTRAWLPHADAMRAGDFLSYTDALGRRRLHMATADVVANGSGVAAIPIAPPIRRAGADGALVEIVSPTGVFMLASDEVAVATRPPLFGSVSLDIVEALV